MTNLTDSDLWTLSRSWITPEMAEHAGLQRVSTTDGASLIGRNGKGDYAGIAIPYHWPGVSGTREFRLRLDHPELEWMPDGTTKEKQKYLSPQGRRNLLYFAPGTAPGDLDDITIPVLVTEGEKKVLALARLGQESGRRLLPLGLSGCWNWRGTVGREPGPDGTRQAVKGPIPDLARIAWENRPAFILYDSDRARNTTVRDAERGLAAELKGRGAIVRIVALPDLPGLDKTGCDDYLASADGGPERMLRLLDEAREYEPDLLHYPHNDSGNAARLIALYGPDIRYCHAVRKWLYWTGTHWETDRIGHLQKLAKLTITEFHRQAVKAANEPSETFSRKSLDARRVDSALYLAQCELPVTVAEMDRDAHLLNFRNGTVDLRSGELLSHRPDNYITKHIPHDYKPEARCPLFLEFVTHIMGGKVSHERAEHLIDYLQTALGYSLTATTIEKVVQICWGSGDNGKSTLLELFRVLLGNYAASINIDSLMAKQCGNNELSDLADLRGARYVRSSETEQGQRLNEARLKRITQGMGVIRTARKYENMIEFNESHKLWIDANHRPVVRGQDNAIWNRLVLIPFEVSIPKSEQDQTLGTKLLAEAEGILAWAVAGAVRWYAEGLSRPTEVTDAVATWRAESDPLKDFTDDRCELRPDAWVLSGDLWAEYEAWTEANGVDALSRTKFNERLRDMGCRPERRKVEGKAKRAVVGIELLR